MKKSEFAFSLPAFKALGGASTPKKSHAITVLYK